MAGLRATFNAGTQARLDNKTPPRVRFCAQWSRLSSLLWPSALFLFF
jgi:hypothetical protein